MHLSLVQLEGKKIKIKNNHQIQRNIFKEVHNGDSFEKYYIVSKMEYLLCYINYKNRKTNSNEMQYVT